jgi:hypothetical protein
MPVENGLITPLEYAYEFFNIELFDETLPQVEIALGRPSRCRNFRGGICPARFPGGVYVLALNPDYFSKLSEELTLSILVHEMAHVWQLTYSRSGRRGYHNREWAELMKDLGLYPSATGRPGGKETGRSVGHYIVPDDRYACAYRALSETGFNLRSEGYVSGIIYRKVPQRGGKMI